MTIALPAYAYEEHLPGLIAWLGKCDQADEITLNFEHVRFYTPGALVLLLSKLQRWKGEGKVVHFEKCEKCQNLGWLQRVDFFLHAGIELPENFVRHPSSGRFFELRRIGGEGAESVEELSTGIADCIFPDANVEDPEESGLFDLLQYSVSELANNVRQHSRSQGFAMAQYTGRTDLIRVAIADSGIGITRSFTENGSPFWKEGMSDAEGIELALQPKVSSKGHLTTAWGESINAGVGLTLLKEFAERTEGNLFIASGKGIYWRKGRNAGNSLKTTETPFNGTVCSLAFTRSHVRTFVELMQAAKQETGLLPASTQTDKFFS